MYGQGGFLVVTRRRTPLCREERARSLVLLISFARRWRPVSRSTSGIRDRHGSASCLPSRMRSDGTSIPKCMDQTAVQISHISSENCGTASAIHVDPFAARAPLKHVSVVGAAGYCSLMTHLPALHLTISACSISPQSIPRPNGPTAQPPQVLIALGSMHHNQCRLLFTHNARHDAAPDERTKTVLLAWFTFQGSAVWLGGDVAGYGRIGS